jgi:hypothetical protein
MICVQAADSSGEERQEGRYSAERVANPRNAKIQRPLAKVIVVSGQGDKQNALRAVGAGAYDRRQLLGEKRLSA